MGKQQVLDVLNELEAFEIGEEGYALVWINDNVVDRMNAVGVSKEDLEQYGEKDEHFCKWAFAFDQGYANNMKADRTLIWEEREGEEAYKQATNIEKENMYLKELLKQVVESPDKYQIANGYLIKECDGCGASGFSGYGTDYGAVCSDCGGTQAQPMILLDDI